MIADIYGKISRSGSNLSEILEDKLTGDIFGVLRYLPSEKLLLPFLRKAYWIDPDTHEQQSLGLVFRLEPEIIFWPRNYLGVEPDIEIRGTESCDRIKIFIEVKYKSGLSSDDNPTGNISASDSDNQLIRQIRALANDVESKKKIEIFLTEDGAYPQEILDRVVTLIRSDPKLHNIRLYWLSWHDITSIAENLLDQQLSVFEKRIIEDILQYCSKKGFRRYELHQTKMIPTSKFVNQFMWTKHTNFTYKKWRFAHE